ncbi:MAG: DUF3024 domain-containing protein [Actinomycetes bacterium]
MTSNEIPETDVARIRTWCATRTPAATADQVRVVAVVDGPQVVIAEERPPWDGGHGSPWETYPLARVTYVRSSRTWNLEVSSEGDRFRKYPGLVSGSLEEVLAEIDEDPTFVFWG